MTAGIWLLNPFIISEGFHLQKRNSIWNDEYIKELWNILSIEQGTATKAFFKVKRVTVQEDKSLVRPRIMEDVKDVLT